jgi:hypothetical protein
MAKFSFFKRLLKEDFPEEAQKWTDTLGGIINPAFEAITRAFNKDITFTDNINCQVKDIEVEVDAQGEPRTTTAFKSELKGLSKGIFCIRATNISGGTALLSGAPFITFSENNGTVELLQVTGLPASTRFRLRIISVG